MSVITPGGHIKRSLRIAGLRTSVALEQVFWDAIEALAVRRNTSIPKLIEAVDKRKLDGQSLASALRCEAYVVAVAAMRVAERAAERVRG